MKEQQRQAEPRTLFIRVVERDGLYFDRKREAAIFQEINRSGQGPRLYGIEGVYRVEEFIVGSRNLLNNEMNLPETRRKVAFALANFHSLKPDSLPKIPLIENLNEAKGGILDTYHEKVAEEERKGTLTAEERALIKDISVLATREERNFLHGIAPDKEKSLVFSHNDLLAANILVKDDGELMFIDYEYATYNYRCFDIGNYINETMMDYSHPQEPFFRLRPDLEFTQKDVEDFVFHYAVFSLALKRELQLETAEMHMALRNGFGPARRSELESIDIVRHECKQLIEEIKSARMMSHAYWSIWAIIFSKNPDINFDYVKYAHARFGEYLRMKKLWFSAATSM
jgi:thiamine kinase-like enzyme